MRSFAAWAVSGFCGSEGVTDTPELELWAEFCSDACDQTAGARRSVVRSPEQPSSTQSTLRDVRRDKTPTQGKRIGRSCPLTNFDCYMESSATATRLRYSLGESVTTKRGKCEGNS